jgi:hypothetical protein
MRTQAITTPLDGSPETWTPLDMVLHMLGDERSEDDADDEKSDARADTKG